MKKNLLYVGLDVHAQSVSIAIAESGGEVRNYGAVSSSLETLEKTMGKMRKTTQAQRPGARDARIGIATATVLSLIHI